MIKVNLKNKTHKLTKFFLGGVLLFLLIGINTLGWGQTQTFTSSGSFTVPAGVTSVSVECWGGGGAGGGQNLSSDGGGGGGGGAYSRNLSITVTSGNTYTVVVGAGGIGVVSSNGGNGGDSYFINATTILAKGGIGGQRSTGTPPVGGVGGTAASGIGTTKFSGGQGEKGRNNSTGQGGYGGSSAGNAANGWSGPQTFSTITYPTANTPTGGGNGGNGGNQGANGAIGAIPGGGGGGSGDGNTRIGGDGGDGQVIISWVVPTLIVNPTTLDLGYVVNGGTSSEYSYAISGSNLSGAPDNILVTAPSNFEVSLTSASGFASSVNLPYTGATLASTMIYVRFKPTTPYTNYNGNITNSGGGASTQNVAVTGTSQPIYCNSSGNTSYQTSITLVDLNTINNVTAKPSGYSDYTSLTTNVTIGNSNNLTVKLNTDGNYTIYARAWIDWNQNGSFNDAGEAFDLGTAQNTTNGISSLCPYSITVPSGALSGNTRMRISTKYNAYPTSCEIGLDGEVEDYTINVITNTITTAAISGSPFCAGSGVSVPFTITGTFTSGNVFTAELSDANGSFVSPVNIGTITSTTAGTINGTIPIATLYGTAYRIRVVSNTPFISGTDNASNLTVNLNLPVSLTIAASANPVCSGTSVVFTATPTNGGSTPAYQWKLNGNNVGSNSSNYTNSSLTNNDVVSCILTSNIAPCSTGNPASSDALTMTINPIPVAPPVAESTICIGSTATLFASGAVAGDKYKWYDAASGGNLLKTSTDDADNNYTTPVLSVTTNYWVSILSATGCESSRTQNTAIYPSASPDDQNLAGTNSWIGHAYDGTAFNIYYGTFTETETFDRDFGGSLSCFNLFSSLGNRSIYTETFTVRYRMDLNNPARKGLFVVDLGSDDGGRLTVDGSLLYNNWADQSFSSRPRVLMSLTPNSSLVYDFSENGGQNRVVFQNLTLVLSNTLAANVTQSICLGNSGTAISGDVYSSLPSGVTLSGTGYQWTYSTTLLGIRTNITGATGANFTPNSTVAPFNVAGTYYVFRNTILSSTNNVSPNPYVATNESNAATIIVNPIPVASFTYTGTPYCSNAGNPSPTFSGGGVAGIFSSTAGLYFISTSSGQVNLAASNAGTYTVTNTIVAAGGCSQVSATSSISISTLPAATISYSASPFCKSIASAQSVTRTGTAGGVFTALPAGLTINASTGAVTPSTSTAGSYTVFYTISAANGCGVVTATTSVTITAIPTATISYTATPYCASISTPQSVTLNGTDAYTGGVFSSAAGLSLNTSTGAITPSSSTQGAYTVTYTIAATAGCSSVAVTTAVTINPAAPVTPGSITGTASQCPGLTAQIYSINAVSNATIYTWTLPTGWSVTAGAGTTSITVTTGTAGQNGNITVTAGNSCGTSAARTLAVTVSPATPATPVSIIGTATQCPGLTAQIYSISPVANATTYTWTVPTGWSITAGSGTASITVTTGTAGQNGNITVTAGNSCGTSATRTLAVTVSPAAPATPVSITGTVTQCPGLIAQIYSISAVTNATIYTWTVPIGWTVTAGVGTTSITVTTGTAGQNGNITVTAGNSCGTSAVKTLATTVSPAVPSTPGSITGTVSQCPGLTAQIYSISAVANATTYTWTLPTGWSITAGAGTTSITVTTGTVGQNGNISVTAGNSCGTSAAKTLAVTVSPAAPAIPGSITGTASQCPGLTAQIYSISAVTNATTYTWTVPAGWSITAGAGTTSITVSTGTTGQNGNISVIAGNSCGTSAARTLAVIINPILTASLSITASANPACSDSTVTYTAVPTNGGTTPAYQWKVNGLNAGTNNTTFIYTPINNDVISCILTSNASPCATGSPATSNTVNMTVNPCINKWKGSVSSNWNVSGNWTQNFVPATDANIIFDDLPVNHCQLDQNRSVTNITNAQSTYRMVCNGYKLTVKGIFNFTNGAKIDASASGSTLEFAGGTTQSIPSSSIYNDGVYNLTINNVNNVLLNGNIRLLNAITATSGRLDAFTNSPNVSYAGSISQTIEANKYLNDKVYNLTIDNASGVTLNANFTVNNALTINAAKLFSIASTKQLTVSGILTNNAGTSGFVMLSDASGTASLIHATNNVAATVQRYVNGSPEAWHFLSAPVLAQSISGNWTPSGTYGNGTGYDLYAWNEASNCWIYKLNTTSAINWTSIHPGSDFVVGRGYLYSVQASNPTNLFAGNLNNAAQSYALSFNSTDVNLKGFNFVGNPYPSSIDWQAASGWARSNLLISGSGYDMWIYNKDVGNYGVCNSISGTGTNGVNRYIAPMQGFFVRTASSATLGMDNTVRVHTAAGLWLKNTEDVIPMMLNVKVVSAENNNSDEVRLLFGYKDNQKGAAKLFSPLLTAPSLYIPYANELFTIRYLTDTADNPMVPLMFKPGTDGKYTLSCNFSLDQFETVMLEDRLTHYLQNMKAKNTYSFQSLKDDDAFRFVLHFGPDENYSYSELPARIYMDGVQLIIDLSLMSNETEVIVYDAMGRLLLQTTLAGATEHKLNLHVKSQILLVHLKNQQGNISRRLFFNNKNE